MPILVVSGVIFLIVVMMYNGFISRRNGMRNAFASIDIQLKKRWDLVPNLVETTKGFAAHERETLEAVIRARNERGDSQKRFQEEEAIGAGIGRMIALSENYPELTSSSHFLNLQRNLTEIESQLSASRRAYNAAVTEWNEGVESFPGNLMAGFFKFKRADWFEVAKSSERNRVDVNLS
ncbi:LemA family protein [Verrucomicrobiaceae bacterium 227]